MLNVKAKTALLNLYAFVELDDRNLESIIRGIESKAEYIASKGVTESWAHVIEPLLRTLARAFPTLSNWASSLYKPKNPEHVQFRDDCVPHLRTLCGEMRSEARKSQLLRHKPKFDAEESDYRAPGSGVGSINCERCTRRGSGAERESGLKMKKDGAGVAPIKVLALAKSRVLEAKGIPQRGVKNGG